MESYEDSVKLWENYIISDADIIFLMMEMYKESKLKKYYDFILKQEAELIKKICDGKTNFMRVFTVYHFLLWKVFFSINNYFEFNRPSICVDKMPGLSVILGTGVCFDIASHFCNILKYIDDGYRGHVVGFHVDSTHQIDLNHAEIEKNACLFSNSSRSEPSLLNHANVLITGKYGFFVLDPTNFLIYKVVNSDNSNLSPTRIELRVDINLDNYYNDVNELKKAANGLKRLNDELANREYRRCNAELLSRLLDIGVDLCNDHMKDIKEFRMKYENMYKLISLNMTSFSEQVNNKIKKLV